MAFSASAYRVGDMMMAPTWWCSSGSARAIRISTIGIRNERVLPEPVHACTATSLLVMKSGIVADCTGVMRTKPSARTAASTGALSAGRASSQRRLGRLTLFGALVALAEEVDATSAVDDWVAGAAAQEAEETEEEADACLEFDLVFFAAAAPAALAEGFNGGADMLSCRVVRKSDEAE